MLLAMEEYCKDIKYKHLEQIIQEFSPTLGSSKFEFVLEKILQEHLGSILLEIK